MLKREKLFAAGTAAISRKCLGIYGISRRSSNRKKFLLALELSSSHNPEFSGIIG